MREEDLTGKIIKAAIEVHKHWGPGLYEEIYEKSFCKELKIAGIEHKRQMSVSLIYKGESLGDDLRIDVLVENKVVVENKAVKELLPIHEAQLLTYMKLTGAKVGLLINYNVNYLKKGLKRFVL